jgi:hypothetical protein
MALFLKDRIGGSQFDNSETIHSEVGRVMKALDLNHDNGLEMADVEGYWRRLESLLTAEEVSEWIVLAVQLPKEVGRIFLENGVTGYDFPEIVQNAGSVLQEELGLKSSFRSKIVRGVQARMLGIGSMPDAVRVEFTLSSCRSVGLKWSKSQARIFPVHSYRVQRRATNLFDGDESNSAAALLIENSDGSGVMSTAGGISTELVPASAWKTVYVGGETEFVDSTLELGHNYMYRIQAWNSVGRSPWEYIDLDRSLRKKGCSKKSKKRPADSSNIITARGMDFGHDEEQSEWFSIPKKIVWGIVFAVQFVYHSARVFFMAIAMGGAIMRFKRASASSSATATAVLPFPWFWKGVNRISVKCIGHECIPRTMLGDREAILQQDMLHDERVMATGLRGYTKILQRKEAEELREITKSERDVVGDANNDIRNGVAAFKHKSTGNLLSSPNPKKPPREVVIQKTTPKFGWKRSSKQSDSSALSSDNESATFSPKNDTKSEPNTKATRLAPIQQSSSVVNDGSTCIVCQKKFKLGKRYRHHCSRCMATFCHKHGKATHTNFTSCRVPGSCLCNPCLELTSSRARTGSPPKRAATFDYLG